MRVSTVTRLVMSVALLACLIGSCAMLITEHYIWAGIMIACSLTFAMGANYYLLARPISTAVTMLSRQFDQAGFEPLSDAQSRDVEALLNRMRSFRDREVAVFSAIGARYGDVSVIWVQYLSRKTTQLGFAWLAAFDSEFRAHGQMVPTLRGEAVSFSEMFDADTDTLGHLLPVMPVALQRAFAANCFYCYEFHAHNLLADFYVDRAAFARARNGYFDNGVASFLTLINTLAESNSVFRQPTEVEAEDKLMV